jgi:hypothetical protein
MLHLLRQFHPSMYIIQSALLNSQADKPLSHIDTMILESVVGHTRLSKPQEVGDQGVNSCMSSASGLGGKQVWS